MLTRRHSSPKVGMDEGAGQMLWPALLCSSLFLEMRQAEIPNCGNPGVQRVSLQH